MSDFSKFAALVHAQYFAMSKHELFTTALTPDNTWAHYLEAFPEGTNPIFRTNTEHDCSCCRQFIKNIGNVVAIVDGQLVSVWDVIGAEHPYDVVAAHLASMVKGQPITGLFRSSERSYGAESTKELLFTDGTGDSVKTWHHFHAHVYDKHFSATVGKTVGEYATTVGVFKRGLEELKPLAFRDVIELIEANGLYRGEEHLASLKAFQQLQSAYRLMPNDLFVWLHAVNRNSRFRNTAIGSLIIDLSGRPAGLDDEGEHKPAVPPMPFDQAVKSFEAKVAPTNYKRPTALITPKMVELAMATIKELDLEDALARRFAKLSDVSVNNVRWVDGTVQGKMKDGIEGVLMAAAAPAQPVGSVVAEHITIDDFMATVLPRAKTLDLLVKNSQQANFMSITAPVHADSKSLFKWDNDFAWSYDGNITDSIKERVKAAGGRTDAKMRVSLAWFNHDDLDIHVFEPNGYEIWFRNRTMKSPGNRGCLDVDMNAGYGTTRTPVENVVWDSPGDGVYRVVVNNYANRDKADPGFTLEVENSGAVHQFSCATSPRTSGNNHALDLTVKKGVITDIKAYVGITGGSFSQEKWGVPTEQFVKVNTVMLSPNHWDGNAVGNKHYCFLLDGCVNPMPTRGIYNEFLNSRLEEHRKVFEVLGDKTKCPTTPDQLSGVGFSSTKSDLVLVNVTGDKLRKTYHITF